VVLYSFLLHVPCNSIDKWFCITFCSIYNVIVLVSGSVLLSELYHVLVLISGSLLVSAPCSACHDVYVPCMLSLFNVTVWQRLLRLVAPLTVNMYGRRSEPNLEM
jgi:hypothetical protein